MTTELEQTQLELARTQLAQEQLKLQKMQRRHEAKQALGQGAMTAGGAAVGAVAGGASAVLRYAARYIGWAAQFALIVGAAYFLTAWAEKQSGLTFGQRLDFLLGLPGAWGAFITFVVPVFAAPRMHPFSAGAGAAALRIVVTMGFLIYLATRTSLLS